MLAARESMLAVRESMLAARESMLAVRESMLAVRESMLAARDLAVATGLRGTHFDWNHRDPGAQVKRRGGRPEGRHFVVRGLRQR